MGIFGSDLPPIMVGEADRHDLLVLAMGGIGHSPDQADDLLYELGRAKLVADKRLPPDVVRMGSRVVVSFNGAPPQSGVLSYPRQEGRERISIFSPLGTALIGLRAGQSMRWTDRTGQQHEIRLYSVSNPG
ncbi:MULTISPECIES: GreA/GreB family elongation factor [unclassified Devosia]|uniref:GreA/GreB family elongation factor n=1 Tax=unclassified Devosia TaxID=196773 RepID=UPI000FDB02A1|nr:MULTISPECIES: GreA/GreB family elongation factor [unclassified Devosia]